MIFDSLKNIGDELESKGFKKSAAVVTNAMETMLDLKTAQYVGSQGFVIRNGRCWEGCYRTKRVETPDKPAQEVWFACHEEYLKSINDDESGWEKYAEEEEHAFIKTASKEAKKVIAAEKEYFSTTIASKIEGGMPIPNAVFSTIEDTDNRYKKAAIEEANKVMDVANVFREKGHLDLSEKLYDVGFGLLKEAEFGQSGWQWGADAWQGAKNFGNKVKGFFGSQKGQNADISARIKRIIDAADKILANNRPRPMTPATSFNLSKMEKLSALTPAGRGAGRGMHPAGRGAPAPKVPQTPASRALGDMAAGKQPALPTNNPNLDALSDAVTNPAASITPTAPTSQPLSPAGDKLTQDAEAFMQDVMQEQSVLGQEVQRFLGNGNKHSAQLVNGALEQLGQFVQSYNQSKNIQGDRFARANGVVNALQTLRDGLLQVQRGLDQADAQGETTEQGAGVGSVEQGAGGQGKVPGDLDGDGIPDVAATADPAALTPEAVIKYLENVASKVGNSSLLKPLEAFKQAILAQSQTAAEPAAEAA